MPTKHPPTPARTYGKPARRDPSLGPLQLLPGLWKSEGRGWSMTALPFAGGPLDYRLLLNQYNEQLEFKLVDNNVPNRGIDKFGNANVQTDQFVVTLDYQQTIQQVAAVDEPDSKGLAGKGGLAIHHEPGLWLHMKNQITDGLNIARLASIPHGDSVLALGRSSDHAGVSSIPHISGLPEGVTQDIEHNPYLQPYKHFHDAPFKGVVNVPGFPGFDPTQPHLLLELANQGVKVAKTTVLAVDSTVPTAGISNIPFVVRKANATALQSTFWIQELEEKDVNGEPKLRLQYLQLVLLDFFPRKDGFPGCCPGPIRWPHVAINTLEKQVDPQGHDSYYKS